jgi:hypothetical protein
VTVGKVEASHGVCGEADCPSMSWIPLANAVRIIVRCLLEFTGVIA